MNKMQRQHVQMIANGRS